jgi:hypothetical protein
MSELAKAMCLVMSSVRYVTETGKNQFHRYSYASDEDLLTVLQPSMAANGLAMMPVRTEIRTVEHSPDAKGRAQWRTELVVTYRLLHVSGESVELQSVGCGIDGEDKGAYKAMTGALKYALRNTFLVPTGQDPERLEEQPAVHAERTRHSSWKDAQTWFCASLRDHGVSYDDLAEWCTANKRPRPSEVDGEARSKMIAWVASPAGQAALKGGGK